jgi:hypothetical protein
MKKIIWIIFSIIFLSAFSAFAGSMYVWTDEQGNKHITEYPPDKPGKIEKTETFKEMTPKERERYDAEQKRSQQNFEYQERSRQQKNQLQGDVNRAREAQAEREEGYKKERIERAKNAIKELEVSREQYTYEQNNARSESDRLFWKKRLQDTEREIEKNKQILRSQ